ncbi:MAG: hypothetical protein U5N21_11745 [Rhodococcus sp. (in: high G+C Gram-positive bacteria)]|nr:hypothetical protein [Rhodococcus sp. (in: high G+C Gram-positive bacteria)]
MTTVLSELPDDRHFPTVRDIWAHLNVALDLHLPTILHPGGLARTRAGGFGACTATAPNVGGITLPAGHASAVEQKPRYRKATL